MYHLGAEPRKRLQRNAMYLHDLGPRAFAEFMVALAWEIQDPDPILEVFRLFENLTPEVVAALKADRFAPPQSEPVP